MREFLAAGGCLALLLLYFMGERFLLSWRLRRIPLRIGVTGTRGKSSVTRLIAASLREAGFKVLAKTTGSRPSIIFPDGIEEEILRDGPPSILEQKMVVRMASQLEVDALVVEMMSIQPECLHAESLGILKPRILAVTNVRQDHMEIMGWTRDSVAAGLAEAIAPGSEVFIPEDEIFPVFKKKAAKLGAKISAVMKENLHNLFPDGGSLREEFEENIRLALAVVVRLGIPREKALKGMAGARPDFGSLRIWKTRIGSPPDTWHMVNAFAANDPESTRRVLAKLRERIPFEGKRLVGLLNFREDRGDRTLQWMRAIRRGDFDEFGRIVFAGARGHAIIAGKRVRRKTTLRVHVLKERLPEKIMEELSSLEKGEVLLVGMGNIGRLGREMVGHWEKIGAVHGH